MPVTTQRFCSIPEAGRRLGRSARTIRRLIERGQLSAIQIEGTHDRIPLDEVESFTVLSVARRREQ